MVNNKLHPIKIHHATTSSRKKIKKKVHVINLPSKIISVHTKMRVTKSTPAFSRYVSHNELYTSDMINNSKFYDLYGFRQSKHPTLEYEKGTEFLHLFTTESIFSTGMNYVCLERCNNVSPTIWIRFDSTEPNTNGHLVKATTFIGTDDCYIDWNTLRIYKVVADINGGKLESFSLDPTDGWKIKAYQ